ncbi:cadherin-related family member 5 isoform X2 [Perognathus longimembris pacificus]|uniref:cadherin-related family member 5 isoform X2 n=1 Tax=Perognathus longimembris pacificus TaxID=214514 RepID=UPI002018DF6E|nr:cadherin-related family member 5 isoform X2 [Perognathus longimembris pacificus]
MGALALLGPPLLLPLLLALLDQAPGAVAQAQVCSVSQNYFQFEENTNITGPLANFTVPEGQHVELSSSSTPFAFEIKDNQLFLKTTLDYEKNPVLQAQMECKRGNTVVTHFSVLVIVLDINDNAPEFPFTTKHWNVTEDTQVNSVVIPEAELQARDEDKDDTLFYTLREVTQGASSFFSLEGANRPALKLVQSLDYLKMHTMTFQLIVQDTLENTGPSHTATASLVLNVLPADLRPPWFLPCAYLDGFVCLQAQYHGIVPTGHRLPFPLTMRPGPIYAVDGDRGINQPIVYTIVGGNEDDTFTIDSNSGNLTMAKSVPSPTIFVLLIRAEQADGARYSVTKATVEARDAAGNSLHFLQSTFRGTVESGSGAGVAVKDATSPTRLLRIWAEDSELPDLNGAIRYRITNSSDFEMDGQIVLTTTALELVGYLYAEVEANNTVTGATATAVAEIHVTEQKTPATPSTGTTLRLPVSSTPGPTSTVGASTSPQPATPGGGSTQTPKPGSSQPTSPTVGASTSPQPATPGGGSTQTPKPGSSQPTSPTVGASTSPQPATPGGGSTQTPKPGSSQPTRSPGSSRTFPTSGEDAPGRPGEPGGGQRFSTVDMAVLGGVLGALLLLALTALLILIHKHYGHRLNCCSGKAGEPQAQGFDNQAFLKDEASGAPAPSPETRSAPPEKTPAPPDLVPPDAELPLPTRPGPEPLGRAPGTPAPAGAGESPSGVRSILTKERRPEGGYKAVWFGEDIGAEADVVVLNTPAAEADGASDCDAGSEGSGEEDAGGGARPAGHDSTHI